MEIPEYVPWCSTGTDLGSGRQGNVCLVTCKNELDGAKFALKELKNTDSDQARQRFQREIEAVKMLDHPNIVRVIDHSKEGDDFQYYVMEYHEGARTLASIISSPSTSPFHGDALMCLYLFRQIVSAIGACEESNYRIVHRDISPKNILVLVDYTILLIDFGICQFQDGQVITLLDEGVGARNYTAPECESGIDASVGTHSDLYSAAKVLWSAITSRQAFAREAPVFGDLSMIKMFPKQPSTWHLSRIFEKTIRENPANRFQGTDEVLALSSELGYLIRSGFPPLEDILGRCPLCGCKSLKDFPEARLVFGISRPKEKISALVCNYCGHALVRDHTILRDRIEGRRNLS